MGVNFIIHDIYSWKNYINYKIILRSDSISLLWTVKLAMNSKTNYKIFFTWKYEKRLILWRVIMSKMLLTINSCFNEILI